MVVPGEQKELGEGKVKEGEETEEGKSAWIRAVAMIRLLFRSFIGLSP